MTNISIDGSSNDTNLIIDSPQSVIADSTNASGTTIALSKLANKVFRSSSSLKLGDNDINQSVSYRFNSTGTAYDLYIDVSSGSVSASSENKQFSNMKVAPLQFNPLKYVGELSQDPNSATIDYYQQSGMLFNADYTEINLSSSIGGPLIRLKDAGELGFLTTIPSADRTWWQQSNEKNFFHKDPYAYLPEVKLLLVT